MVHYLYRPVHYFGSQKKLCIPNIDTSFPVTAELRGVVPLVDASVVGSDVENANEVSSLNTPFNADGLSAAKVIAAAGLSNFTTKAADGTVGSSGASSNSSALVAVISASIASSSVSPGRGSNFKCSGSELWWSRYHIRVDQVSTSHLSKIISTTT